MSLKLFGKWTKEEPKKQPEEAPFAGSGAALATAEGGIGQNRKILVVDDNPVVLKAFELKLKALGFTVLTATEGASAVSTARQQQPDLIVLDINFPPDVMAVPVCNGTVSISCSGCSVSRSGEHSGDCDHGRRPGDVQRPRAGSGSGGVFPEADQ